MRRRNEFAKNRSYYLMMLPALIMFVLFAYGPLPGLILAFKNYDFAKGIFGSPWNGLKNFRFYFNTNYWSRTTFNTVWINFNNTLWETVIAVTFAIFLNEIANKFFKRAFQILIFLPYFFSAVIIGRFVYMFFNVDYGIVNQAIKDVAGLRGRLGAFQKNVLGSTINALNVALENVSSSNSAIRDTDFATETSNLTRNQILVQAAGSVLSQANSAPQSVLRLLG